MRPMLRLALLGLSGCTALPSGPWYAVGGTDVAPMPTLATLQGCIDSAATAQDEDRWALPSDACENVAELEVSGRTATFYGPHAEWGPVDWRDSLEGSSEDFEPVDFDLERLSSSALAGASSSHSWRLTSWEREDVGDTTWQLDCEARQLTLRCETLDTRRGSRAEDSPGPITFIHADHPLLTSQR